MVAISYQTISMEKYEASNSAALLSEHIRQDSLASFNELVLAYQDDVYRQALWIIGDEDAAEDATQEAFLRAFRNLHTYNGGPFRPWILKITTNYCLDQLRRQKFRKTLPLEALDVNDEEIETSPWLRDPGASVEELCERSEEQARIAQAIRRLPAEYRSAVVLADIQGIDYSEASNVLGIPLGTFKSRLSRARQQLQRYLAADVKRQTYFYKKELRPGVLLK